MSTPGLQLRTLFELDGEGRILATREPLGTRGPLFELIRGDTECVFAVRSDVPGAIGAELAALAREEALGNTLAPPRHAARYLALLEPWSRAESPSSTLRATLGCGFDFSDEAEATIQGLDLSDVVEIDDEGPLLRHFTGWFPGELRAGRTPAFAVLDENGHALSVCFCARRREDAAEAGLETAAAFRRRGLGARATAAWARAVRQSGRIPLYSARADNTASLAVATKLRLRRYAIDWAISLKP